MGECTFCEIVTGIVPAEIVVATEEAIGFLDRSPLFKGHVLVAPRPHVVTLADLPAPFIAPYFALVQRVASVMPQALGADGTFVAINNTVSQSVAHLHAHVVPRRRKDGLRGFFWPREKYVDEAEAARFAMLLREALRTP